MRICLITLDFWPYRSSGLAVYAEDLARGLSECGHDVTVIAALRPNTQPVAQAGAIEVQRVPVDSSDWISYSARAARKVHELNRQRAFDVVHFLDVHFAWAYRGPFVASLWQSFRQRLHADGGHPYASGAANYALRLSYYTLARHWMERVSLARAGRLLAAASSTAEEFINHYGVEAARISRAVQGGDLAALQPVPAAALRAQYGLEGKQVLLSLGFAGARKGLEYLAQALQLLPPNVVWVMVGQWAPGYRRKVFAALEGIEGGVANRVIDVGPIADEERAAWYSLADLYVSPSLLEGFGWTPIEAQACGTPAIVTDASSGREEVGDAGVVVPARDPAALAQAIAALLADPARRAELSRRARVHAQRFSYQNMAAETLAAYAQFLDETRQAEPQ